MPEKTTAEMKRTLGVTGLTMNAMALIAPGAFLWLSFAGQAAYGPQDSQGVEAHAEPFAHAPGELCEGFGVFGRHRQPRRLDEEEPIASPSDVPRDFAVPWNLERHLIG